MQLNCISKSSDDQVNPNVFVCLCVRLSVCGCVCMRLRLWVACVRLVRPLCVFGVRRFVCVWACVCVCVLSSPSCASLVCRLLLLACTSRCCISYASTFKYRYTPMLDRFRKKVFLSVSACVSVLTHAGISMKNHLGAVISQSNHIGNTLKV